MQKAGAKGGIVVDNSPSSSSDAAPLFAMSGDGMDDVNIPLVFLYSSDADILLQTLKEEPGLMVTLAESTHPEEELAPTPAEIRVDDEASILPVADLSTDGMVEKLRSEVKRIVVERMKEEAESNRKAAAEADRSKGTFIIRMDEKGSIVTEAVDSITVERSTASESRLESYAEGETNEEEPKQRKAFITLLRMTLHLLLALKDEQASAQPPELVVVDDDQSEMRLADLPDDVRHAVAKVFRINKVDLSAGICSQRIEDVLSSFRTLWPDNVLPRRYFHDLERVLQRLSRPAAARGSPEDDSWNKGKGERIVEFMRSIRGEFAAHLRHLYSRVASGDRRPVSSDPKPNRTPDEL